MIKAIFIDFYGTVVHEDGEVIRIISEKIMDTGNTDDLSEIGSYWWNSFQRLFMHSYGDNFVSQRELEKKSLVDTLEHFESTEKVDELSSFMFAHWIKPPAFEESKEFFEDCKVPIYIVSNIDRSDIEAAIQYHDFSPTKVFTSEDGNLTNQEKNYLN